MAAVLEPPSEGAQTLRRRSCILGTAGHIDHGKSSLVQALTGTNPDRLPEEQRRGMTIELGFAHFTIGAAEGLPEPVQVGIVDVPGHERFVKTMVSGATGIDLGLLVVAADDGVMPQTLEHVDILELLGVGSGLVAISKSDLVSPARVDEVQGRIDEMVDGTGLGTWPAVAVSAKTGEGLDSLRARLAELIARLPPPRRSDIFRMAIDRVFTVHGRGTVVTGSVLSGRATPGMALELHPDRASCRVRELQSFGDARPDVTAGQRAALNLTGADRSQIERGMELATPGYLTPSRYVDARIRVLRRRPRPVSSFARVRVCMGAAETMATLVLIGADELPPGAEGWAQLRMHEAVTASYGQRFILRDENGQGTIGGGQVVRPAWKRVRPRAASEAEALRRAGDPDASVRLDAALRGAGLETRAAMRLACEVGVEPAEVVALLEGDLGRRELMTLGGGRRVHRAAVEALEARAEAYLQRYHATHPREPGLLRDRLTGWIDQRGGAGCGRAIVERLIGTGRLAVNGPYLADAAFRPTVSPEDAAILDRAVAEIAAGGCDPPEWSALRALAGMSRERLRLLEEHAQCDRRLVAYGPGQYISKEAFERLRQVVMRLGRAGPFKLAQVRDELKLNRRAVQPLLEHLDRIRFTRRVGEERVLVEGWS